MSWPKWVLLGWVALNTLMTVAAIGKPRGPITPSQAVYALVVVALVALLVVIA